MKISELVEMYITLRDLREARKKAYTEADATDKAKQEKIEAKLLELFQRTGMDSLKTAAGTAYSTTRTSATVADKETFMTFVRDTDEWPLLEVRAAKTAIEQYKEIHEGELPPGVNWREEVVVNVRRS